MRDGYVGTGPGSITPDGCAVQLWRRLPVGAEPEVIAHAIPPRATILELGAGVGRMTHPLVEQGFRVTAVDESAEMLSYVHGAQTVHSTIEDLRLGLTFDVVVLASYLVHTGDRGLARAFLETCRVHAGSTGQVLIQRRPQETPDEVSRQANLGAGGVARVTSSDLVGDGVWQARVEHVFPDATWTQTFIYRPQSYQEFEDELSSAGLHVDRYLTEDRAWAQCSTRPLPSTAPDA